MAGSAAGVFYGVAWFLVTTYLRRHGWVDWALETWLAELLRVRDLVITEDLVDAGWNRWEERRKNMRRLNSGREDKTQ